MANALRSQSAMEYLMTYGWAILIVAVVLGALYSLGIFNGANFLGGTCVASPGYLCSNPLLATDGTLSLTYGYQGPNVTVAGFACTNTTTAPSSFTSSGSSNLEPGQEESVSVSCPLSSSATIGTSYSGYLWVEYDQAGQSDLISRFATVRVDASTQEQYYVWVANYDSSTISVISTSNNVVVKTITLGSGYYPVSIAITPNGQYVYVTDSNNGDLSVINTVTYAVTTISLGPSSSYPWDVAFTPNGQYAYVVLRGTDVVDVINTATLGVSDTITLPSGANPWSVSITPNGQYAYIVDTNDAAVNVISTSTLLPVSGDPIAVAPSPTVLVFAPNGNYGYLISLAQKPANVISTSTNLPIATFGGYYQSFGAAVTPNGQDIFVTDYNTGVVYEYSTSTYAMIAGPITTAQAAYGVAVTPNGEYAYVTNQQAASVTVINVATGKVITTIPVGLNPEGVAITPT